MDLQSKYIAETITIFRQNAMYIFSKKILFKIQIRFCMIFLLISDKSELSSRGKSSRRNLSDVEGNALRDHLSSNIALFGSRK